MEKYYIWLKDCRCDYETTESGVYDTLSLDEAIGRKRKALREYYIARNLQFARKHGISPLYSAKYSHCMVAELTRKSLRQILEDDEVSRVERYCERSLVAFETDIISRQIGVDSIDGSHSRSFISSGGYLGDGVKVGVVSAQNLTYIADDAQLRTPVDDGQLVYLGDDTATEPSVHSSVVTSIIVGGSVNIDGTEYRGVAPQSTVFLAPSFSVTDVYEAIEKCLDNGAVIINYSAGEAFPDGRYGEFDRQIDTLIYNVGFSFTVAAGNSAFVASPGTTYNGITVGNARTKSSALVASARPFTMFYVSEDDCSAYRQDEDLPNKPDIAAPGTYVHYINRNDSITFNMYGTSFATPYVAGVAAQIVQKYPEGGLFPMIVKAVLLGGADGENVSSTDNPTVTEFGFLREKSGAGFLNSVDALENMNFINGTVRAGDAATHSFHADITISIGRRVRIVLCYMKNVDEIVADYDKNNITLELYTPGGTRAVYDDAPRENVKLIEYTANVYGVHTVVASLKNPDAAGGNMPYCLAWRIF